MNDLQRSELSGQESPLLSIVIISWNTRDILRNCLASVFQYTQGLDFEVIVIDNASVDGSVEMVKHEFPQVQVVINDSNVGTSRACNNGMRRARGRLLLLLGSDTFVGDDVIAKMAQYLLSRPEISM